MSLKPLSLAVVGVQFQNKRGPARRFDLELCQPGDPIELRREPKNPADPNAIAVFSERNVQLGYITAERAPWIGKLMGEYEVIAVFQQVTRDGGAIRVSFDGRSPSLKGLDTAAFRHRPEQEFWPDDVYPDE